MKQNYLKQVMVLNKETHDQYLEVFVEEPLSFEEYINYTLGFLFDEKRIIESIIPMSNAEIVLIIYLIQIT